MPNGNSYDTWDDSFPPARKPGLPAERDVKKSYSEEVSPSSRFFQINLNLLHSNLTIHAWAFGAFAELIDNAQNPDVGASYLFIGTQKVGDMRCLIFLDNGTGMDKEKLCKMLSFGNCDKDRGESNKPVRLNGNGFKSGSMRLGKDALVISRCDKSACVGFLSQTYLETIGAADSVIVPLLEYSLPELTRSDRRQCCKNLKVILKYSIFKTEASLKEEMNSFKTSVTGTKIFIFNLNRLQCGDEELDFESDGKDIRCPEPYFADTANYDGQPIYNTPEYKNSLGEYCSTLYLRPRMRIFIRGNPVRSKFISKMLSQTKTTMYRPIKMVRSNEKPIKIIFGFSCETDSNENYGLMLYHKNRLIRAYERVGYQKQQNNKRGVGVIGVVELDFLTPTCDKKDFDRNDHFNSIMAALAVKLNAYWNSKRGALNKVGMLPDWNWVQCEECLLWRRLPLETDPKTDLPKNWLCYMNKDERYNRCFEDEEPDAPVGTPQPQRKTTKKRKTKSTQDQGHSTAIEPSPKRKMIAVNSSRASSKSQIRSQSHKGSSKTLSKKSTLLNTSKIHSDKSHEEPSFQNNMTNSFDHDDTVDQPDNFDGKSPGSYLITSKEGSLKVRLSRPLSNVNKTSDRIQNSNDEDQVTNQSSMEHDGGYALTSMENVKVTTVQSDQPVAKNGWEMGFKVETEIGIKTESEIGIETESEIGIKTETEIEIETKSEIGTKTKSETETRTGSTFHQNVHKLVKKILPGEDIGDVRAIEIMVSNMINADTSGESEHEISNSSLEK